MPSQTKNDLWKQRLCLPTTMFSYLAKANPERGLVVSNRNDGILQLYAWDIPTGKATQLTHLPKGVFEGQISADGRFAYYLADQDGNEIGHIVRIPFEGGEPLDLTPDLPPYTLRGLETSHTGNILAFNPINQDGFQLWAIDISQDGVYSAPRRLYQCKAPTWGATLSQDGELAAMISTERAGGVRRYSTLVFDTANGELVGELWDADGSIEAFAFSPLPGDMRLLLSDSASGFRRPLVWNPRSGEQVRLDLPGLDGEVIPLDWAWDGKRVLLNQFKKAAQAFYLYNLETCELTRLRHPDGSYGYMGGVMGNIASFGSESEIFTHWQDATHPLGLIALDAKTGVKTRDIFMPADIPPSHPWQSITFPSSDGQEIQAWLSHPAGDGPFPTLIQMHGGPHAVETEAFKPLAQAWVDHGVAYLVVNFRGSTTFGRDFQEKIWGDLGHWELEDIVAARNWLVEQAIARPEAILLTGASYGGYMTLLGLGKRPDLWAGGIAEVAISDWKINYEDASDVMKGAFRSWFRGSPDEVPERYAASSPVTYAGQIQAPILVYQGRNDTRTTPRQMEQFEAKLKALGKEIEVRWFDAGHMTDEVEAAIASFEQQLAFARRVTRA